jgi:DNA repair exonuclease SbcCD nuclease subunit
MHQTVEGATVGIQNYTFRYGDDIIRGSDIPQGLDAVLSGHIHRAQVLNKDLSGNNLNAPVIYPGSIDRTSYVEREEEKGYYIISLEEGKEINLQFNKLDTRPMKEVVIDTDELTSEQIEEKVNSIIKACDPEMILRLKPAGEYDKDKYKFLTSSHLRKIAPSSMNVEVTIPGEFYKRW